jgi:CubicO group peptidase (beta-lactamase class C family)
MPNVMPFRDPKMNTQALGLLVVGLLSWNVSRSCTAQDLYFPNADKDWEITSPESLGWDLKALESVFEYVEKSNGKSFLILKDGKIVAERYWTPDGATHAQYIMSSGKSITAFLTGIAREQGKLKLEQPASDFLGTGWSRASNAQEKAIRIEYMLEMTSGLNGRMAYEGKPGSIWKYNTEVYQQLHPLLEKAVGSTMQEFTRKVLFEPLGMRNSRFRYHSFVMNARDMGRFGLMILAKGNWNGQPIMKDRAFFDAMLNSSQQLNQSYGYLWWLNGKESFRTVGQQRQALPGPLVPDAPKDMVCANGKGGQRIYVVPSLGLVVVRLGDNPVDVLSALRNLNSDGTQSKFDNQLWGKLMLALPKSDETKKGITKR